MIKESVGNAAKNKEADLKIVKTLVLKIKPPYNVAPYDSERKAIEISKKTCEPELVTFLARFQKMAVPVEAPTGGRVMPGSKTIARLKEFADASEKQSNGKGQGSPAEIKEKARELNDTTRPVVIMRDVRLEGWKPKGDHVLEVGEDTPLAWAIQWVVDKHKELKKPLHVQIMAHGVGVKIGEELVFDWEKGYPVKKAVMSQGGGGIQFCDFWIQPSTVKQFAVWKGKVSQIDLLSCGAAYITAGFEGKRGDGNWLCYTLAQHTGAVVRASTATQIYYPEGERKQGDKAIDFTEWEGMIYTYGPNGELLAVENSRGN